MSTNDPIDEAVARLIESGLALRHEISGCSEQEIDKLEQRIGFHLPTIYRQFLLRLGRSAGRFMEGSDFLYSKLQRLYGSAEQMLRGSGVAWKFCVNDFVFLGHQGYEFLFIRCLGSDDPPVFRAAEGETPQEVFPSFSAWLRECTLDEIEAFRERKQDRL